MEIVWQIDGKDVPKITPPKKYHGFVYELTLTDNKKYIGKKSMWSVTKKKLTQKEIASMVNKREKKWKFVTKESDWRKYTSSSKLFGSREVKRKEILAFAESKRHLTYLETKFMFERNVIEDDSYLNSNVLGKFYRGNLI